MNFVSFSSSITSRSSIVIFNSTIVPLLNSSLEVDRALNLHVKHFKLVNSKIIKSQSCLRWWTKNFELHTRWKTSLLLDFFCKNLREFSLQHLTSQLSLKNQSVRVFLDCTQSCWQSLYILSYSIFVSLLNISNIRPPLFWHKQSGISAYLCI